MKDRIYDEFSKGIFQKLHVFLGFLTSIGLLGYGITYLFVMPKLSPEGFVPNSLDQVSSSPSIFSTVLALFVLIYAFSFLPIVVMFTIKKYNLNPYAIVLSACLLCLSIILDIINNLPIIAAKIYPGDLETISSSVLLHLQQVETIRFLSFDVAGFTLAYIAFFIYAIIFFRINRVLSIVIFGSIALFILNVPFLWFAPNIAIILMVISIFAYASVPIFLTKMTTE